MSLIKATGIIADHLGNAPIAGIGMGMPMGGIGMPMGGIGMGNVSMGYGPMGYGAIRPTGSLGGLMPVSFDNNTRSVLHPAGMPIATTLNPLNPYDANSTIVSNPFGGLSGMTGITGANFGFGNLGINNVQKIYKNNGVDVIISGCNTDVKKVIECLDSHLLLLTSPQSTITN